RASRRDASGASLRNRPTFSVGLIAVCGVALLGGGLLAARATMGRRGRPVSPRVAAGMVQSLAPPAATKVLAPVAELAPDAAGEPAIVTGTAPVHPQPAPPPSVVRRPRARRAQ